MSDDDVRRSQDPVPSAVGQLVPHKVAADLASVARLARVWIHHNLDHATPAGRLMGREILRGLDDALWHWDVEHGP